MTSKKLAKLFGQRYLFTATYAGVDIKDDGHTTKNDKCICYYAPVIKLSNIFYNAPDDEVAELIDDHLAMNYSRQFSKLGQLIPGEKINFMARVSIHNNSYFVNDYYLSYPTKAKIIHSLVNDSQRYPLPEHGDELVGFAMETSKEYYLTHNQFDKSYVDKYDAWCNQQAYKKGSATNHSKAEPNSTTKVSNQNRCHDDYDTNSTEKKEGGQ